MNSKCFIHHPTHGQTLQLVPAPKVGLHFAASGVADPAVLVGGGVLYVNSDPSPVCFARRVFRNGTFWALSFVLPDDLDLQKTDRYRLVVLDIANQHVASSCNIGIESVVGGIVITYPADNDSVCPAFAAYGSSTDSATLQAVLEDGQDDPIAVGTVVDPPPAWTVAFSGLPVGLTDLALVVTQPDAQGGPLTGRRGGLTVMGCAEMGPPPPQGSATPSVGGQPHPGGG